jgi:hypothetical protein
MAEADEAHGSRQRNLSFQPASNESCQCCVHESLPEHLSSVPARAPVSPSATAHVCAAWEAGVACLELSASAPARHTPAVTPATPAVTPARQATAKPRCISPCHATRGMGLECQQRRAQHEPLHPSVEHEPLHPSVLSAPALPQRALWREIETPDKLPQGATRLATRLAAGEGATTSWSDARKDATMVVRVLARKRIIAYSNTQHDEAGHQRN